MTLKELHLLVADLVAQGHGNKTVLVAAFSKLHPLDTIGVDKTHVVLDVDETDDDDDDPS